MTGKLKHGTLSGYTYGRCRCEECRHAKAKYQKQRRLRLLQGLGPVRVDATGTYRRVQGLQYMGWPLKDIAARVGMSGPALRQFMSVGRARVSPERAAAVAKVFEELCMTPGPSQISRTVALRNGYAPPLAWNDIDDPADRPRGVLAA